MTYRCDLCNYETVRSTNYSRHLKSLKHINNEHTHNEHTQNEPTQNRMSLLSEHTQNRMSLLSEHIQNEHSQDYGNYKTVHTAEEIIEPEPDDEEIAQLKVIGDIASKVNTASKKAIEKYKPEIKAVAKPNDNSSLAIVLISLLISAVIIYVLFRDKIDNWLSNFDLGNSGSVINPDNTKILRD